MPFAIPPGARLTDTASRQKHNTRETETRTAKVPATGAAAAAVIFRAMEKREPTAADSVVKYNQLGIRLHRYTIVVDRAHKCGRVHFKVQA